MRGAPHSPAPTKDSPSKRGEGLMQRTLESRVFISAILAMAAGTFLFYAHPFPDEQIFLHVIALPAPTLS